MHSIAFFTVVRHSANEIEKTEVEGQVVPKVNLRNYPQSRYQPLVKVIGKLHWRLKLELDKKPEFQAWRFLGLEGIVEIRRDHERKQEDFKAEEWSDQEVNRHRLVAGAI